MDNIDLVHEYHEASRRYRGNPGTADLLRALDKVKALYEVELYRSPEIPPHVKPVNRASYHIAIEHRKNQAQLTLLTVIRILNGEDN